MMRYDVITKWFVDVAINLIFHEWHKILQNSLTNAGLDKVKK